MTAAAPAVFTKPTFTAANRIKIQQDRCRDKDYTVIGRLTTVVFAAQRSTIGLSGSRARWHNPSQAKEMANQPHLHPFSERQTILWSSITLDWLTHKNAPVLAVSRDGQDLLLPNGMAPLPPIPDPRWVPEKAGEEPPRLAQLLTGCPVCGDRVQDKITARDGRVYGVLHPITELCVVLYGMNGTFGKIRGMVDPSDGTHLALLIDDSDPRQMRGHFVGGKFQFGG